MFMIKCFYICMPVGSCVEGVSLKTCKCMCEYIYIHIYMYMYKYKINIK